MKIVIGMLLFLSFSSFAQSSNTLIATVDVGGCLNSRLLSPNMSLGENWEIRLIPANKLNHKNLDRMETEEYADEVRSVGRKNNFAVFRGPILEAKINLEAYEKLIVEVWEKDRGLHNFFRHEGFVIAEVSPSAVKRNKPFVKGEAIVDYANDCLTVTKE